MFSFNVCTLPIIVAPNNVVVISGNSNNKTQNIHFIFKLPFETVENALLDDKMHSLYFYNIYFLNLENFL